MGWSRRKGVSTMTTTDAGRKRVNRYFHKFKTAQEKLNKFMSLNEETMEEFDALSDEYNAALDKLQRACREEEFGIGPISVSHRERPVFDGSFLWDALASKPEIRDELITVEYKVKKPVFERLAKDGQLTQSQIKKAVAEVKHSVALTGVPESVNLV